MFSGFGDGDLPRWTATLWGGGAGGGGDEPTLCGSGDGVLECLPFCPA